MSGYPMAWEAPVSMDHLPSDCPYSIAEMEAYLFVNHYHWSRGEAPTTFSVSGPCAEKAEVGRRYWLFDAAKDRSASRQEIWCSLCQKGHVVEPFHDQASRVEAGQEPQWFVIVGTGKGCFDPASTMRR